MPGRRRGAGGTQAFLGPGDGIRVFEPDFELGAVADAALLHGAIGSEHRPMERQNVPGAKPEGWSSAPTGWLLSGVGGSAGAQVPGRQVQALAHILDSVVRFHLAALFGSVDPLDGDPLPGEFERL